MAPGKHQLLDSIPQGPERLAGNQRYAPCLPDPLVRGVPVAAVMRRFASRSSSSRQSPPRAIPGELRLGINDTTRALEPTLDCVQQTDQSGLHVSSQGVIV